MQASFVDTESQGNETLSPKATLNPNGPNDATVNPNATLNPNGPNEALNPNPKGPRTPENRVLGPKYHSYYSIWAPKPYYLGPWTLRVMALMKL